MRPTPKALRTEPITDERGVAVTPFDPLRAQLSDDSGAVDRETLGTIAREVGVGLDTWPRRAFLIGVAGVVLAFSIIVVQLAVTIARTGVVPWAQLTTHLVVLGAVQTGIWLAWTLAKRNRARRVGPVMLAHARCPHCGVDLSEQDPNPSDGARLCPGCGCRWRIPRMT